MNIQPNATGGAWTTGLCGCFDDIGSCLVTACCPCITFGQSASAVDPDSSCFGSGLLFCLLGSLGVSCLYSYGYRNKLREQYRLPEEPCGDCLLHCCCQSLAICQEYRELKNRGVNPSEGSAAMAAPVVAAGMPRN